MLNPNIIARDLGLADKQELDATHKFSDMTDDELERELRGLVKGLALKGV